MGSDSRCTGLDDYAARLIKYKARQLVGHYGYTEDDRPDIEQDLTLDLLQRLAKFDCSRASLRTFIDRIVNHGVARLIEGRKAEKRDYRRCACSLNDVVDDGEGDHVERGELVNQDDYLRRTGQAAMPVEDSVALRVDLERFLAAVPAELGDLATRLADGHNITDISRATGIPRGTLYERMKQLKALAEDAGLGECQDPE